MAETPADHAAELLFGDDSVFGIAKGVESARHVDGLTVRHGAGGSYFSLNATGQFIWEQLGESRPLAEVKQAVAERFGVPPEESGASVEQFVGELVREGLLLPDTGKGD